ncbi:methyltransferase-like protein 17, mitochondrial [Stomoxys calcitrans]|uniref:methyltransferase-like protein 17, mitochondrial n=1 Tax=Stomoxys calcitrans TaxID=35570 RepID=UPI0027E261D1|nr:methyltransferase-like protein 17, mitochondrial [Stomoxys calcitrans]
MKLCLRNVSNATKPFLFKEFRRYTSKFAVKVDETVQKQIEVEGGVSPRRHPGIINFNRESLPERIQKTLERIVGDYPVKGLLNDCKKLNQFISSRHPPAEDFEINTKIKQISEEIDEMMPPEERANLDEEGLKRFQKRKEQLMKRRMKERTFAWKPIQYGSYESIVYALGRGPLEYAVLMRVLHEIRERDKDFKPQSFLDFGSGIGTGMWSVSSLWKDSIYEYYNVDSSRYMNDLSELILKEGNANQQMTLRNVFYRQFLPALETKYDLVLSSYSLFELSSAHNRHGAILNLWKKCDGYLIIVEEGSRRGSELVNEARDLILSQEDHCLVGHVFAPCPHDSICPRLSNTDDRTPCNFQITYTPTKLESSKHKDLTARFSYVVLKKGLPTDSTRLWPRLVRPTLVRSKHSICRMCTSEGTLTEIIFTQSKHGRSAYRCARSSRWGDRLPIIIEDKCNTNHK